MCEITDQTKIDMGTGFGLMEVQAIRSVLRDQNRAFHALKKAKNREITLIEETWQMEREIANDRIGELEEKNVDDMSNSELIKIIIERFRRAVK